MRAASLVVALCAVSASAAAYAQAMSDSERAGIALADQAQCGGELTPTMKAVLARAIAEEGSGAVRAKEMRWRAIWATAEMSGAEQYMMCERSFRNGWLE